MQGVLLISSFRTFFLYLYLYSLYFLFFNRQFYIFQYIYFYNSNVFENRSFLSKLIWTDCRSFVCFYYFFWNRLVLFNINILCSTIDSYLTYFYFFSRSNLSSVFTHSLAVLCLSLNKLELKVNKTGSLLLEKAILFLSVPAF